MAWLKANWITESIVLFPLIVENLADDREKDHTNVSKMAKNLQKYGLRRLGAQSVDFFGDPTTMYNWKEGNYSNHEVLWEHDTMNIYDAKRISDSFQNSATQEFNIDCWQLSYPEGAARARSTDLKSIINVPKGTGVRDIYLANKAFLKDYISKKLS